MSNQKTRYLLTSICIMLFMDAQSQRSSFDSLVFKLQFQIFADHPDSCVLPFLKRYLPCLAEKPKSAPGGWTMYPSSPSPIPQEGLHSLKLAKHPALHCPHSGTRLDILTQEQRDFSAGIKAVRVWFYFDTKGDAVKGLQTILDMFKNVNAHTKVVGEIENQTVMLYENGNEDWVSAKLIVKGGKAATSDYSILFLFGSDNGEPW